MTTPPLGGVPVVTRPNKVYSASYFTRETEGARYYLSAKNLGAVWLAGSPSLEVAAGTNVEADDLHRLFDARDANGRSLLHNSGGVTKRVAALELSVGVSKTVSMAWALGTEAERAAIEVAFFRSLQAVADQVGKNAFARLGGGQTDGCCLPPARHAPGRAAGRDVRRTTTVACPHRDPVLRSLPGRQGA